VRREGAAALALSSEHAAHRDGQRVLARVGAVYAFASEEAARVPFEAPPPGAVVVLGASSRAEEIVARSAWANCRRVACAPVAGRHEATGAIAIAVATGIVARGDAPAALFVGCARGSGVAGVLLPPEHA
jgi:hypothetical protein